MDLNSLILLIALSAFNLLFYKYFFFLYSKYNLKLLVDDDLKKPQAFHITPIPIVGGLGIYLSFLFTCLYLFLTQKIIYFEYLAFCTPFFILGFIDDLKLNIRPKFRLILMIIFLIFSAIFNEFYIENTGIGFLNRWLEIDIFALFFVCLCFLFIINGANLVDGYNGLLGLHSLIILINLFFINYFGKNFDLSNLLLFAIIILATFLWFNFPKATIFLGDGGSYLLGVFIAISTINTSLANPAISPFYFCILLFYLFFEVFFSFIRKLVKEKSSPVHPDSKHLHMLLYQILLKKNNNKLKSNYHVSILINLIFLTLIIPSIIMMKDGFFCKYYSILFFIVYIFAYKMASKKINNQNNV